MALTWTDDDVAVIKDAILRISRGEQVTQLVFSDRTVTYQSVTVEQLLELLATAATSASVSGGSRVAAFSKGLD